MTREEAIAILEVSKHMATSGRMYNQAIDMAIEALSADTSSDIISRADAIEAVNKEIYHSQTDRKTVVAVLSALPSAEAVQGWIPCSERLPSAEDCPMDCMVTRRSKYVGNYTDMAVAEADGTWTHEDWKAITINGNATCISTKDADIIAWMPLPTPYKGGDSE